MTENPHAAPSPNMPSAPGTAVPEHVGPAWLTNRRKNLPAVLRLSGGRLSLTLDDGLVFDERVSDLDRIHVPWYWFSGGIVVTVRGHKQKIAFVRPEGAQGHGSGLETLMHAAGTGAGVASLATGVGVFADAANLGRGVGAAMSIAPGRRAGKTWRALLGV